MEKQIVVYPYHRILLNNCDVFVMCQLGHAELKFPEFLFHLCFWLACDTFNVLIFHLYILLDKVFFQAFCPFVSWGDFFLSVEI